MQFHSPEQFTTSSASKSSINNLARRRKADTQWRKIGHKHGTLPHM
jgi:hypothetical protein